MSILELIQLEYLNFSSKEQKIANYILENISSIQNMNISIFAKNCNVSTATVTRFCKKINLESFANLKIHISKINVNTENLNKTSPLAKIYSFYKEIIESTNRTVNIDEIKLLYEKIKSAKRIFIYGIGSSGLTGNELMLRLIRMGFDCQTITDSHLMLINSSISQKDDLVIALSVSGETLDIINAIKLAKNNNCYIISITSFPNSSIAIISDFFITIPNTNLLTNNSLRNNQFSTIYIIDVLTSLFLEEKEIKEKMNVTINTILKQQKK